MPLSLKTFYIMKKIIFMMTALIVAGSTAFAHAEPSGTSNMAVMRSGTVFKVFYKSAHSTDVKISITNKKDKVVFTETLRKIDGFVRPYNFTNLEEGEYTIEVTDEYGKQFHKVYYSSGRIENLAHLIRLTNEPGKYMLTLPNKGEDVVSVKIYDESFNVLYNHTEKINGDYAKVFNVEKIKDNTYLEIISKNGINQTLRF
jgi:ABC-type transporter MlaC component